MGRVGWVVCSNPRDSSSVQKLSLDLDWDMSIWSAKFRTFRKKGKCESKFSKKSVLPDDTLAVVHNHLHVLVVVIVENFFLRRNNYRDIVLENFFFLDSDDMSLRQELAGVVHLSPVYLARLERLEDLLFWQSLSVPSWRKNHCFPRPLTRPLRTN